MKKFFADRRNIVFATVVSILLIALTVLTAAAVVQQKKSWRRAQMRELRRGGNCLQ